MNKTASQIKKYNTFHVGFTGAMLQFLNRQLRLHDNDFRKIPPEIQNYFSVRKETREHRHYPVEHLTIYSINQPKSDEARHRIMKELGIDYEAYIKVNPVRFDKHEQFVPRTRAESSVESITRELGLNDEPPPELLDAQMRKLEMGVT